MDLRAEAWNIGIRRDQTLHRRLCFVEAAFMIGWRHKGTASA